MDTQTGRGPLTAEGHKEERPDFDLTLDTLPLVRTAFEREVAEGLPPTRPAEVFHADGTTGAVELRRYRPRDVSEATPSRGTVFCIHGGGYVLGSARMMDGEAERLADALHADVVNVDYPLAPEHPHPAPLLACQAGLRAVAAGMPAGQPLLVSGNSAGGGLAAALVLKLLREGAPMVAALDLHQPMLDHRTSGPEDARHSWTAEFNRLGWDALRGGAEPDDLFSPALARDLSGFPPTLLTIGEVDLFLDECLDFAARLARAGVEVDLCTFPNSAHAFERLQPGAQAERLREVKLRFLDRHLAARP